MTMNLNMDAGVALLDAPPTRPVALARQREICTPVERENIQWRVITDRAELGELVGQWSQLAEASSASLFVTPEWIQAWLATIGQDVQPRVVTACASMGRLIALWPMGLRCTGRGMTARRVLEPMGEALASGDRLNPLMAVTGLEQALNDQVRCVAQTDADLIHWGELSTGCRLTEMLTNEAAGNMSRTIHTRVLPWMDLPASYDEFTARLGKKLRGHIRRQEQIALQQHSLTWRLNDEGTSLASAVQAFVDLHQQCWQHRGKNGNLAESRFRAFVEEFAASAEQRGWLRLHRLCDGQQTVAALLAFHYGGRACYYQSGWNPAIAELSPGSLCVARAVRAAIEEGLTVFDFLRGDEPYKRRWADRQDETITQAEAITLKGRAILAGRDVKECLKCGITAMGGNAAWERLKTHLRPRSCATSTATR